MSTIHFDKCQGKLVQLVIKGCCCFIEQETLPSLLSTGGFQEHIWAWFTKT